MQSIVVSTAQYVLCQYLKAVKDNVAPQGAEQVMVRHGDAMLRSTLTGFVCQ